MRNDELTDMMNGAIGRLVKNATRIALSDFSAVPALVNILKRQGAAAELRKKHESEGLHVPPFMIASIVRLSTGAVQFALAGLVAALVGIAGEHTAIPLGVTMLAAAIIALLGLLLATPRPRREPAA